MPPEKTTVDIISAGIRNTMVFGKVDERAVLFVGGYPGTVGPALIILKTQARGKNQGISLIQLMFQANIEPVVIISIRRNGGIAV